MPTHRMHGDAVEAKKGQGDATDLERLNIGRIEIQILVSKTCDLSNLSQSGICAFCMVNC